MQPARDKAIPLAIWRAVSLHNYAQHQRGRKAAIGGEGERKTRCWCGNNNAISKIKETIKEGRGNEAMYSKHSSTYATTLRARIIFKSIFLF